MSVPVGASIIQIYGSVANSLGLPGGTVPGEILGSNQLAAAFSNAKTDTNGTISVDLTNFSYLNQSRDLSLNVTSASLRATIIIPTAAEKSDVFITTQLSGVVLSAQGYQARLGSAQISADIVVNQRIANVTGSALYDLIVNLKPSDASGNIAIFLSDLSYHNPYNSSSFSASSIYSQFSLTQGSGNSIVNVGLQLAGVQLKTSSYSGPLSFLQVTGNASVNESSGALDYSYDASTTLLSVVRGILGH